ncbi:hypothetical protein FGO68_gene1919 [Halteria grandinella]|uniref:Uncharacterized protein n=1 Tax=Halteria grandinella TaxID=5974 RepID=A0A8J8NKB2_HALGN|nr:hypothetical protein FGO68_gene1919 [Halteria grandinella]
MKSMQSKQTVTNNKVKFQSQILQLRMGQRVSHSKSNLLSLRNRTNLTWKSLEMTKRKDFTQQTHFGSYLWGLWEREQIYHLCLQH